MIMCNKCLRPISLFSTMCKECIESEKNENNSDNRNTDTDAYLEQIASDELLATNESEKDNPQFRIECISYRKRLTDTDGISYKAAIDGIVQAGILPDDSAKYIKEITYRQIKIKDEANEKTVFIVEEV